MTRVLILLCRLVYHCRLDGVRLQPRVHSSLSDSEESLRLDEVSGVAAVNVSDERWVDPVTEEGSHPW
jgi:hypothetical protein